ncbi:fumarylacetoacetate hydrolase family protein [Geosporobacter ferrireducens]|uniref:Hydrolase n=1 Tax=Geosporobacter ferrireducens TaxID=1424294 RepID=A0A1D8GJ75_9FIRM|nr:fumarylacetoacetate hydrolase family protein [Geosporobacter ferrireducens]AOT70959.1 hydrolase [Geosporobacter ferrireducens]MTI53674.1 fumarylacetoacetate hydrolase family protein [Geosporobacter ferrireducens]
MYFATYLENGSEKIGVLNSSRTKIMDMEKLYVSFGLAEGLKSCPKTMLEFVEFCHDGVLKQLQQLTDQDFNNNGVEIEKVKLCAPIPYPKRNIFCLGKNYLDHAKEVGVVLGDQDEVPQYPIYFSKVASPATGHGDVIEYMPGVVTRLDYEVELAIVIGKEGKNIPKEKAEEYIFGYTILNDVSERGLQKRHGQWHKGKSLDTFSPMGPYLVHKSMIPFPVELEISCSVNGEVRQQSNTNNLIFDIPTILSDLSKGMTLKSGDIIATGTPAGVGMGFSPFKFLNSGDIVSCSIEKIGTLTNPVK